MKYRYRYPPYKQQREALKFLLSTKRGGALLMEPRTGKTKVGVDYASVLWQADKVKHVLVICPIAALTVWRREIERSCADENAIVRVWDKDTRGMMPNPPKDKDGHLVFILINDDAFSVTDKRSSGYGRLELRNIFRSWGVDLCILDESHRIKSPSAKRSRVIHTFQPFCKYRVIMTGTPVTKKKRVIDVYSQWKFLNPDRFADVTETLENARGEEYESPTFAAFKDEFTVITNRPGYPLWLRNKNMKKLRKRIHADAYEISLAECRKDLPPKMPDQVIEVELTSSRRPYDDMVRTMMAKLDSGEWTTADISLVRIMRLAQFTSGIAKTTEGEWVRIGTEKLDITRSLLSDWFEAEQKIVLAARFREDVAAVYDLGKKLRVPVWKYQGGMSPSEKQESIDGFERVTGPALFVGQPKAMSLSIDLATSHIFVWYSLTNSAVDWSQACSRIDLSPVPRSYVYLNALQSIDEDLYRGLKEDKDVIDTMRRNPAKLDKTVTSPR